MIDFYDNDMSVCAQKVRLVLYEKDVSFERHHLNLRAGDQFKPDYLKLNPNAVVPTLVNGGHTVIESTVIIEYLDDAYPDPSLSPETPILRALMRRWLIKPDSGLHDACGLTSFALAFRHQLKKLPPDALTGFLKKIPNEKRRSHIKSLVEKGLEAPGVGEALRSYRKAIADMAQQLEASAWLAGNSYSLADITMLPYVIRLEHLGLDWFWAEYPAVDDWFKRAVARPSHNAISDYLDQSYLELMSSAADENLTRLHELLEDGS